MLGTVIKSIVRGLEELEIGGQAEIIQTTALLRLAFRLSWVPDSSERPSANTSMKNSQGV